MKSCESKCEKQIFIEAQSNVTGICKRSYLGRKVLSFHIFVSSEKNFQFSAYSKKILDKMEIIGTKSVSNVISKKLKNKLLQCNLFSTALLNSITFPFIEKMKKKREIWWKNVLIMSFTQFPLGFAMHEKSHLSLQTALPLIWRRGRYLLKDTICFYLDSYLNCFCRVSNTLQN